MEIGKRVAPAAKAMYTRYGLVRQAADESHSWF